ncbi:MAG: sigma-70 family RNA polymerase sigma factor [Prolixibacteraceae bacterium]
MIKDTVDKDYWISAWSRFKDGDKEAFAIFYNQHVDSLYQYGRKLCIDDDTVKDAIQEVFLDLYMRREQNSVGYENLKYYLLLALKRNLIRKLQTQRRFDDTKITDVHHTEPEFSIEYSLIEKEHEEEIRIKLTNALNQLPEKQKEAIYLRFNEALDYRDIALILGITVESVRTQIYRALKTVRQILDSKTFTILLKLFSKKR